MPTRVCIPGFSVALGAVGCDNIDMHTDAELGKIAVSIYERASYPDCVYTERYILRRTIEECKVNVNVATYVMERLIEVGLLEVILTHHSLEDDLVVGWKAPNDSAPGMESLALYYLYNQDYEQLWQNIHDWYERLEAAE